VTLRRSKAERFRVAIDIGGTFTDVILMSEQRGLVAKYKVDTTPKNLEACFIHGLQRAAEGLPREAVVRILHASTVATNAVLEGKGARTALVVTAGFRDILEIARQRRPSLYDLKAEKAKPLIPRRLCFEVRERIGADGSVVTDLTASELERVTGEVRAARVESVVVVTLFSYLNPAHEKTVFPAYLWLLRPKSSLNFANSSARARRHSSGTSNPCSHATLRACWKSLPR